MKSSNSKYFYSHLDIFHIRQTMTQLLVPENCRLNKDAIVASGKVVINEVGIGSVRTFDYDQLVSKNSSILSTNLAKKNGDMDYQMAAKHKALYKMFKKKYNMRYAGQVKPKAIQMTQTQINRMRGHSGAAHIGVL